MIRETVVKTERDRHSTFRRPWRKQQGALPAIAETTRAWYCWSRAAALVGLLERHGGRHRTSAVPPLEPSTAVRRGAERGVADCAPGEAPCMPGGTRHHADDLNPPTGVRGKTSWDKLGSRPHRVHRDMPMGFQEILESAVEFHPIATDARTVGPPICTSGSMTASLQAACGVDGDAAIKGAPMRSRRRFVDAGECARTVPVRTALHPAGHAPRGAEHPTFGQAVNPHRLAANA